MSTSFYQMLKLHILSMLSLSKDAAHIYVGLLCFFGWVVLFKKPVSSFKSLVPVLIVAGLMEMFDLHDDLRAFGHFRWSASLHDLINTSLAPFGIVLLFKFGLLAFDRQRR